MIPARSRPSWLRTCFVLGGLGLAALSGIVTPGQADDKDAKKPDSERTLRIQSQNHLKQLALAMHNYHSKNGSFPPVALVNADGKAVLSWRVILLPYLEEGKLATEIHNDEPWDSEHNKKFLERMPKVFRLNYEGNKPGETIYQGFVGNGAAFDPKLRIRITDIQDGTSNTIMFVESSTSVPWTKPEDLAYDPKKPLPKLGFLKSGFNSCFCDGSVRFMKSTFPEKELRACITRDGGETINFNAP
jgi:hypothetical protein